jgi:hypothetical protein
MTPRQQMIYDEIKSYQERMGRFPLASTIRSIVGGSYSTFWITFKRMKEQGYVDYASDFENGKSRKIKVC